MRRDDKVHELFKVYNSRLTIFALRFVEEEIAEDIVQDVFLDLWERKDQLEMGDHISSFLYRSTYSKCLNYIKHEQVVKGYGENQIKLTEIKMKYFNPDNNDVIQRIENEELSLSINQAIEELPDKCREVFRLSYLEEMKNKEIADFMHISLRTVEAHMYKALKFLRLRLKDIDMFILILFFWLNE